MRRTLLILVSALLVLPSTVHAAQTSKVMCGGFHLVRSTPTGQELFSTAYSFRNGSLEAPLTILRLTIRNFFGSVIWDSGPAAPTPHPLNTDFPAPGVDITTVPPGATYYLGTNHIWGVNDVTGPDGPGQGNSISALIEYSTESKRDPVVIGASLRVRQRIFLAPFPPGTPVQGIEHSRVTSSCVEVK